MVNGDRDAHLLLTNHDGELGRAESNFAAVSEGGPNIANLGSYQVYGESNSGPIDSMQTALHEAGHCFMYGGLDGFQEHETGNNIYYSGYGKTGRSPFARQNITNECGESVGYVDYGQWAMEYAECAENKFKNIDEW
jgi:hypothetical protein